MSWNHFFFYATLIFTEFALSAESLDKWEWRTPTFQGHTLTDVMWANGLFLAVGDGGIILRSSNGGETWEYIRSEIIQGRTYYGIFQVNSYYYALGRDGDNGLISSSPDGFNWTDIGLGENSIVTDLAFGRGVLASAGASFTTELGVDNWISSEGNGLTPGEFLQYNKIAYGNQIFVQTAITGDGSTSSIYTSSDGRSWEVLRDNDIPAQIHAVVFTANRFVAVGPQFSSVSTDGLTWTDTIQEDSFAPMGLTHIGQKFYACGISYHSSEDGINWEFGGDISNSGTTSPSRGIAITDNQIVTVGNAGTIWNKLGEENWKQIAGGSAAGDPPSDVVFGLVNSVEPQFVITHQTLDENSAGGISVSRNSVTWQSRLADNRDLRAVAFGNNRFVAVGKQSHSITSNQVVFTSDDGAQTFESHELGQTNALLDVTFGNDTFVAVGHEGAIYSSSFDGENWSAWISRASATSNNLTGVSFGSGLFVAVAESGLILVSKDGIRWSPITDSTSYSLTSVAYGNGTFVAVGVDLLVNSSTGDTWEEQTLPEDLIPKKVKFVQERFIILGMDSKIFSSDDGIAWIAHDSQTVNNLSGITSDGLSYLLIGDNPWDRTPFIFQSFVEEYPFGISDISKGIGGKVVIMFQARPGATIEIQETSDFEIWKTLDSIVGEGLFTPFIDNASTDVPRQFYRGINQE